MTIASLLMGGCGLSHKHVEDGCRHTCVKFGAGGSGLVAEWVKCWTDGLEVPHSSATKRVASCP